MMRAGVVLALAACLALPARALGQEGARVERGARVRVWTFEPGARPRTGEFERWDGSTLVIYDGEEAVSYAFEDVDILELSGGRAFNTTGAVIGGILGTAAGGALGCAANRDSYGVYCGGQSDTKVFVGAALGAVVGVALGGLVFGGERWVPVPLLGLDVLR
jgi:hypothetical protein